MLASSSRRERGFLAIALLLATGTSCMCTSAQVPMSGTSGALPPIVVTDTRSPQSAQDAIADITVIEHDEIERAGPGGLAALLQRQPGVEISRNGGPGGVTGVFLRGNKPAHTIVLIDGVRVGSASTGTATIEAIPLDNIDRIEILRGPASGLYGADAVGGVIQVFTRRPGGALSGTASAGYGTYDTRDYSATGSGAAGVVRFSGSAAHRESRGFNAIANPADLSYNPDRDGYVSDSGSATVALPWAADHELSASALRSRLDAQFDAGPGHDDRTITIVESASVQSRDRLTSFWSSRLMLARSTDDSVSRTAFGDFPFRTREHQYSWLNDITLPAGVLTLGGERREERVDTNAGFDVTARTTNAVLALYQWSAGPHALQANVRNDHSDQFGSRTTGGVRYRYRLSGAWQFTAAASTAFKVPTFNDLYFPGFSNPDLAPETARNVEGGITWRGALEPMDWEARVVAYRNRVRDLIVFQCDASFVCAPRNVDRATIQGATLSLDLRRGGSSLAASIDVSDPTDVRTRNLLPRRARLHGALTAGHDFGPVRVTVETLASTHRFDDAQNAVRLAGYGVLNVAAEWTLARAWSLLVRVDNVLDRQYELASHYGTGGRTAFAALRWQS